MYFGIKGVSLQVNRGEVVVIMGPSGSGKSTFIRTFNALDNYQKGEIMIDGIKLSHDLKNIETIRREVGMVFQQFNLFPHLTVLQNITLAPLGLPLAKGKSEGSCFTTYIPQVDKRLTRCVVIPLNR